MTWKNPTGIKIGMSARLFAQTYQVIGSARLGVMDGGQIYYWNEYYLKSHTGDIATLVYEKSGLRGEWRWFTQFNPEAPLTAGDAATKRQGDYVTIDDHTAQVMLVRESRVYHVEGHAPEGVVAGARANYFNAKDSNDLFVVSWTGDEVEFYRGLNVSRGAVAMGFKLPLSKLVPDETATMLVWALGAFAAFLLIVALTADMRTPSRRPVGIIPVHLAAPALKVGATGTLRGTKYRIEGHAEVEIAEVGNVMIRHEYFLRDEDGGDALLVYGWNHGDKHWLLFTPIHPAVAPTPREAGRMKLGDKMLVGGLVGKITELFRSTLLESDGTNNVPSLWGDVRYGLIARADADYIMARWNQQEISFENGKPLQEHEVIEAFR
jgi:hypothetical protein